MAKRRGHYCWSCDRHRANERFSGNGHARHLCRDCSKLGKDGLEFRQAERDMNRAARWGRVTRKSRPQIERFLRHSNPRAREYASRILEEDRKDREEWRRMRAEEAAHLDELERIEGSSLEDDAPEPLPSDEDMVSDAFFLGLTDGP